MSWEKLLSRWENGQGYFPALFSGSHPCQLKHMVIPPQVVSAPLLPSFRTSISRCLGGRLFNNDHQNVAVPPKTGRRIGTPLTSPRDAWVGMLIHDENESAISRSLFASKGVSLCLFQLRLNAPSKSGA